MVLRVGRARVPVQRAGAFATAVSDYLDQVKKLADDEREEAETQAKSAARSRVPARGRSDQVERPAHGAGPVPHMEFAALEDAVDRLKRSAKAYDDALAKNGAGLSGARLARVQALMLDIDQTLAPDVGLPGRTWYRNLIYAPGRFTGYGAKTLPGVREAIEDRRWADANRYARTHSGRAQRL